MKTETTIKTLTENQMNQAKGGLALPRINPPGPYPDPTKKGQKQPA